MLGLQRLRALLDFSQGFPIPGRERITLGTTSGAKWGFSFVICLISASWPAHNQPTHLLSNQYALYIGLLEQENNM
jgi:hypothetical protein